MKRHNLCWNWQTVFVSDTDKEFFGLLSLFKNNKLWIKCILLDINIQLEQNETIGTKQN